MKKELGLGKLTVLYTIGNLATKVLGFGLFFVYTFYLTKEEIGAYDIILTTLTLLSPIITLQVYDAVLRKSLHNNDQEKINELFTNGLALVSITNTIFSFFFLLASIGFKIQYAYLIYLVIILQNYYLFFPQFNRGIGNTNVYVISNIMYSVLILATTSIALIFFKMKIEGLLLGNVCSLIICNVYLLYKLNWKKYFDYRKISRIQMLDLVSYSIPLIPNALSWWIISAANRYIVLYYMGANANGVFAIALKFPSIHIMLTGIFSMAWMEKVIKLKNDIHGNHYFSDIFEKYIFVLFSLTGLLISSSKIIIRLSVSETYYSILTLMPILYLAVTFQGFSSFLGTIYLRGNNTRDALKTTIQGAAITLIVSVIMIPYFGLVGASLAILFGYATVFMVRFIDTKKHFDLTLNIKKVILILIALFIITLCSFSDNDVLTAINILFSVTIAYCFNKKLLIGLANKIVEKVKFTFVKSFPVIIGNDKH